MGIHLAGSQLAQVFLSPWSSVKCFSVLGCMNVFHYVLDFPRVLGLFILFLGSFASVRRVISFPLPTLQLQDKIGWEKFSLVEKRKKNVFTFCSCFCETFSRFFQRP